MGSCASFIPQWEDSEPFRCKTLWLPTGKRGGVEGAGSGEGRRVLHAGRPRGWEARRLLGISESLLTSSTQPGPLQRLLPSARAAGAAFFLHCFQLPFLSHSGIQVLDFNSISTPPLQHPHHTSFSTAHIQLMFRTAQAHQPTNPALMHGVPKLSPTIPGRSTASCSLLPEPAGIIFILNCIVLRCSSLQPASFLSVTLSRCPEGDTSDSSREAVAVGVAE